jgi:hypothetical protein
MRDGPTTDGHPTASPTASALAGEQHAGTLQVLVRLRPEPSIGDVIYIYLHPR